MAYDTTALREMIEALILGTSGTNRLIDAGRFHLIAKDGEAVDHPLNAAERSVEVLIGPPREPANIVNDTVSGFFYYEHDLTVLVTYVASNAGGDMAEVLGEQDGSGTMDAIRGRSSNDIHALRYCLTWYENWSIADPVIIELYQTGVDLEPRDGAAVYAVKHILLVRKEYP